MGLRSQVVCADGLEYPKKIRLSGLNQPHHHAGANDLKKLPRFDHEVVRIGRVPVGWCLAVYPESVVVLRSACVRG